MHEDPQIKNYGDAGKGMLLRPGMTFAIEPMIARGHYETRELADGCTNPFGNGLLKLTVGVVVWLKVVVAE